MEEQQAYLEKRLTVLTACVAAHGIQTDFALKPGLPADSIASYGDRAGVRPDGHGHTHGARPLMCLSGVSPAPCCGTRHARFSPFAGSRSAQTINVSFRWESHDLRASCKVRP